MSEDNDEAPLSFINTMRYLYIDSCYRCPWFIKTKLITLKVGSSQLELAWVIGFSQV